MYWKLQAAGWSAYALTLIISTSLFSTLSWGVVWPTLLLTSSGLGVTHAQRWVIHRFGWKSLPAARTVVRILGSSLCGGLVMTAIFFPWVISHAPPGAWVGVVWTIAFGQVATVLIWNLIYFGYHGVIRYHAALAGRWEAEVVAQETELIALKEQLNPHFLFNSLNSLRSLIVEEPERARTAVTTLAALLRRTLQLSDSPTTDLASEVEGVRHYLELESIRLEERLRYTIDVAPEAAGCRIPPMLLQTLVENGVRHGIALRRDGGSLALKARVEGSKVRVVITNSGTIKNGGPEGGTGLRNSVRRLRLLYGESASLSLRDSEPGRTSAVLIMPTSPEFLVRA